jgi:hypothetical protein
MLHYKVGLIYENSHIRLCKNTCQLKNTLAFMNTKASMCIVNFNLLCCQFIATDIVENKLECFSFAHVIRLVQCFWAFQVFHF